MAANTQIEWCDHTFNPWEGCQKVGPGCDHCYAETRNARYGGGVATNWGPGAPRRRTSAANWRKPERWERDAEAFMAEHGRRQRVFCASLADVFDNAVDPQWRVDLGELILRTPNLEWLLLTKRAGNVLAMLAAMFPGDVPDNVRIGFTIVTQTEWERDRRKIASVSVACRLNPFLSMEPLLERVTLDVDDARWPVWWRFVSWVIVGGESGPGARIMQTAWVRALRDECEQHQVPFLFKQWGEWKLGEFMVGKKKAGRELDGQTYDGFPL